MIRVLAVIGAFLGSSSVWALPPRTACIPFAPESSDLDELIGQLDFGISSDVTLESACYTESLQQTGIQELDVVRSNSYRLILSTDQVVNRVRFYRRVRCLGASDAAPACDEGESVVKWHDNFVSFDQDITNAELVEVLSKADELLRQDLVVFEVEKTKDTQRRQRFTGEREYRLSSRWRNTIILGYILYRSCSNSSDCDWRITTERPLGIVN